MIIMKKNIYENGIIFIIIIYLFFYIFNFLTPMGFGDDYLYSFVWQGKPEFVPLTDSAVRISSIHDLFASQWSHYFTWSGRTVNHTLAQFFLWMGKDTFNVFNAFIATLLVLEIYWCINRGKVEYSFHLNAIWGIFFALWAFTSGYATVFLWLDGACNYLWTSVLLLGFMLPYIQKYYCFSTLKGKGLLFSFFMFLSGLFTGWTNENSVCWIILILGVFLFMIKNCEETEIWMYSGLAGLILGYTLLMISPGNIARLQSVHGLNGISISSVKNGFHFFLNSFFKVILFQFIMWYFSIRTMLQLKQTHLAEQDKYYCKDILLAKILCIVALGMSVIMMFSPDFPLRSGFPGTVQLVIATGILYRVQQCYQAKLIKQNTKKILLYVSGCYFVVTTFVASYNLYNLHKQTQVLLNYVSLNRGSLTETVLTVKPFKKATRMEHLLSGFHIVENELLEDENAWENVAFARYYRIKGIRVTKEGLNRE